jgi:hypothetical protein
MERNGASASCGPPLGLAVRWIDRARSDFPLNPSLTPLRCPCSRCAASHPPIVGSDLSINVAWPPTHPPKGVKASHRSSGTRVTSKSKDVKNKFRKQLNWSRTKTCFNGSLVKRPQSTTREHKSIQQVHPSPAGNANANAIMSVRCCQGRP